MNQLRFSFINIFRIGRTGREGQHGDFRAISFFSPMNKHFAPRLLNFLDTAQCEVPPWLVDIAEKQKQSYQQNVRQVANNSNKVMRERR